MSIYCFDLDDTICTPHHSATNSHEKYGNAAPVTKVITKVNSIYDGGRGVFRESILASLTTAELKLVYKTTVSLFASMQPLHTDAPDKIAEFESAFHRFNAMANEIE